jgi:hypothetical protein
MIRERKEGGEEKRSSTPNCYFATATHQLKRKVLQATSNCAMKADV